MKNIFESTAQFVIKIAFPSLSASFLGDALNKSIVNTKPVKCNNLYCWPADFDNIFADSMFKMVYILMVLIISRSVFKDVVFLIFVEHSKNEKHVFPKNSFVHKNRILIENPTYKNDTTNKKQEPKNNN